MAHQLKSLLNSNQELHPQLMTKVHELGVLQRHFADAAPASLSQSCQVLGLHLGTLVIAAANTALAAKLRQLAPQLTALLQSRGCEISGIRVKVQVSYRSYMPPPPPRRLGVSAKNALNEFCQSLPNDSALKLTLNKLTAQKN